MDPFCNGCLMACDKGQFSPLRSFTNFFLTSILLRLAIFLYTDVVVDFLAIKVLAMISSSRFSLSSWFGKDNCA